MSRVHIEAYACDEHGDGPAYATIDVTPEFIQRLRTLRQIVIDHGLSEARAYDEPEYWDNGDDLRLTCEDLVVTRDDFWFTAQPKHTDYHVETRLQNIERFAAAVAEGETRFGEYDDDEWDEHLDSGEEQADVDQAETA